MSIAQQSCISILSLKPLESHILETKCSVLEMSRDIEVSQILLHPNEEFSMPGAIHEQTIQCVQGRVILEAMGHQFALLPSAVARIAAGTAYRIIAVDASSLLSTLVLPEVKCVEKIEEEIDVASTDSFPASDPPSHTPVTGTEVTQLAETGS